MLKVITRAPLWDTRPVALLTRLMHVRLLGLGLGLGLGCGVVVVHGGHRRSEPVRPCGASPMPAEDDLDDGGVSDLAGRVRRPLLPRLRETQQHGHGLDPRAAASP